jgi:hypothetical protein
MSALLGDVRASLDGGDAAAAAEALRVAVSMAEGRIAPDARWEGVLLQLGRFVATHVEGAGLDWWGLL